MSEFSREFSKEKPETIQWAFREHRRQSQFFPSIAEITTLVARRRREIWEASETERQAQEAREREDARAAGKLLDITDMLAQVRESLRMERAGNRP